MKRLLFIYRWPVLAIVVWIAVATAMFGKEYARSLAAMLRDPGWWAESTFSVVVFTVLVSWVVAIAARDRARQERAPWKNWKLQLKGLRPGLVPPQQPIWWEDARRLTRSRFERWKFVKSAVSNLCRLRTPTLEDAESRWLTWNETDRRIVIDLTAMTDEDVEDPEQLKRVLDTRNRDETRNQPQKS